MAVSRTTFQGIGDGVAGPWVLRRTKPWHIEEETQVNVGRCEFPGTDGQGDERLVQSSGVIKTSNVGAWRGAPQSLWTEIMHSTGEDIDRGELRHTG